LGQQVVESWAVGIQVDHKVVGEGSLAVHRVVEVGSQVGHRVVEEGSLAVHKVVVVVEGSLAVHKVVVVVEGSQVVVVEGSQVVRMVVVVGILVGPLVVGNHLVERGFG